MTPPAPSGRSPIRRRASRTALVAAIACGLCATAIPSSANADDETGCCRTCSRSGAPQGEPNPRAEHVKPDAGFQALTPAAGADVLGREARRQRRPPVPDRPRRRGDETVTVLLAATPGDTDQVAATVTEAGGTVGRTEEDLGYVRATVPLDAVRDLAALGDVKAIDLNRTYRIPDPQPAAMGGSEWRQGVCRRPGANTPADNPYLPIDEIGATDFVDDAPDLGRSRHHRRRARHRRRPRPPRAPDHHGRQAQDQPTGSPRPTRSSTVTGPGCEMTAGDRTVVPLLPATTGPRPRATSCSPASTRPTTDGSEFGGDVNRDGDTDDRMARALRPGDHRIWVDSDMDHDFTDEPAMAPYGEDQQVGHFGVDDPATAVNERMPFVVEYREDVDLSPRWARSAGRRLRQHRPRQRLARHARGRHHRRQRDVRRRDARRRAGRADRLRARLHVRRRLHVDRAHRGHDRPGHSSATSTSSTCRSAGCRPLNDGSDVIAILYDQLIDQYGVQIVVSAGNDGPGINTVSSPSVAEKVISVAASVSKHTWWADYGASVRADQGIFGFSSRGPAENGAPEADPRRARRGRLLHPDVARRRGGPGDRLRAAAGLRHVQRHLDGGAPGHRRGGPAAVRSEGHAAPALRRPRCGPR